MTDSVLLSDADRDYGAKVTAVEPGGAEQIPLSERHGRPIQLLWTWTSPNLEFATVFVGVLGVLAFGLSFWQAVGAIVLGNLLGAVFHGVLSSWGPDSGLCQMVLSRRAFGFLGNILPAGLNSLAAGLGWFAVNSVSGALALAALTGMNGYLCLVIVVALMLGIAYWIGPWLGVVLADRVLAAGKVGEPFYVDLRYRNWAGPIAMLGAAVVSIWLFSNQVVYTGLVPSAVPEVGDLTFEVGFVLAVGLYAVLRPPLDRSRPSHVAMSTRA